MMNFSRLVRFTLIFSFLAFAGGVFAADEHGPAIPEQTRRDLLAARDNAWRSFFGENAAAAVEKALGPEVIAIQESDVAWDNRTHLIAMAGAMEKQKVKLSRLEFPRTEIQLFRDTAILYYTYIMEQSAHGKSSLEAGRGTEVFVHRDGHWVDVGWHLDSGPFARENGQWIRKGDPLPSATNADS
jgi:hypothetical protein